MIEPKDAKDNDSGWIVHKKILAKERAEYCCNLDNTSSVWFC